MKIILTTLNSRFTHSSIGLRYLYANMKELQKESEILEFSINDALQSVAEKILIHQPDILGIGVYIWNALEVSELIHIIKKVSPETTIILGGPEVSYSPFRVNLDDADFIIQGEGDTAFYELCKNIINTTPSRSHAPRGNAYKSSKLSEIPTQSMGTSPKIVPITLPNLKELELPYRYYTDEDIANRYIYVEISRGCPFECEFCLSSMDEKVRAFNLDRVLEEFEILWQRGARNFKFVDRTFNLNMKAANRILDFFLQKEPPYFAHFEVIPDHFPASLREKIAMFPHGALQLEIGIQTLNPKVADNISRQMNLEKMKSNINFLENETEAHIHLDLIVGLPGESLESFGKNLDKLVSLSSCEIQIGILKKLSGTHIKRHDEEFGMVYSDKPPYDILKNSMLSFSDIQLMKRFARFWDLTYNSGNFKRSVVLLWLDSRSESGMTEETSSHTKHTNCHSKHIDRHSKLDLESHPEVYNNFYAFGIWMYEQTDSTWKISLQRLGELLFTYLTEVKKLSPQTVATNMLEDMMKLKGRAIPSYLKPYSKEFVSKAKEGTSGFNKRQT